MQDLVSSMEFNNLNDEIKRAVRRTALDMVQTGYLLRCMFEKKLWTAAYDCLDEYLERELGMDYTMANRLIGINKKYSVGGGSMEIEPKWEGFSQSVLIEMLSMPPELEGKVTPDMTVKQVREIKQQARQKNVKMKPDVKGLMSHAYCAGCGAPLDDDSRPEKCPGCGQMQDWEWYMKTYWPEEAQEGSGESPDGVIEGEYREIGEAEEVATSQGPVLVKPDERQRRYLDAFAKYFISCKKDWMLEDFLNRCDEVTKSPEEIKKHLGENNRTWFFSVDEGVAHINLFDDCVQLWDKDSGCMGDFEWFYLASAIQRMWNVVALEDVARKKAEEESAEEDGALEPDDELSAIKSILGKEKKLLADYLEAGGIPEKTVFRQKTIVGALAAMVCDLENIAGEDNRKQPELPAMTNNSRREEFLDSYSQWPVWVDVPETGERYYRYQFPNGTSFVVKVYFHRCFDGKSEVERWEDRFSDGWGSEEYYLMTESRHFRDCRSNRTAMVDFLKDFQKKEKQRG